MQDSSQQHRLLPSSSTMKELPQRAEDVQQLVTAGYLSLLRKNSPKTSLDNRLHGYYAVHLCLCITETCLIHLGKPPAAI